MLKHRFVESSIGTLTLVENESGELTHILFEGSAVPAGSVFDASCAKEAVRELEEYFRGSRKEFTVKLAPQGTAFQREVWKALLTIPFGVTASYGQIAAQLGNPNAMRAVGLANGSNPIPIIIPCHRVIGANGSLTGYGGGLDIKRKLLEIEGVLQPALI